MRTLHKQIAAVTQAEKEREFANAASEAALARVEQVAAECELRSTPD